MTTYVDRQMARRQGAARSIDALLESLNQQQDVDKQGIYLHSLVEFLAWL